MSFFCQKEQTHCAYQLLKIFEILWVLLNAKMGKKGTRAKPKQTNPPEGDKCSFPKNSAKDAVVAAKAQPAQLMTDSRKECKVGEEQYSPMSMIASVLGSPQQAGEPFLSGWLKAEKML